MVVLLWAWLVGTAGATSIKIVDHHAEREVVAIGRAGTPGARVRATVRAARVIEARRPVAAWWSVALALEEEGVPRGAVRQALAYLADRVETDGPLFESLARRHDPADWPRRRRAEVAYVRGIEAYDDDAFDVAEDWLAQVPEDHPLAQRAAFVRGGIAALDDRPLDAAAWFVDVVAAEDGDDLADRARGALAQVAYEAGAYTLVDAVAGDVEEPAVLVARAWTDFLTDDRASWAAWVEVPGAVDDPVASMELARVLAMMALASCPMQNGTAAAERLRARGRHHEAQSRAWIEVAHEWLWTVRSDDDRVELAAARLSAAGDGDDLATPEILASLEATRRFAALEDAYDAITPERTRLILNRWILTEPVMRHLLATLAEAHHRLEEDVGGLFGQAVLARYKALAAERTAWEEIVDGGLFVGDPDFTRMAWVPSDEQQAFCDAWMAATAP